MPGEDDVGGLGDDELGLGMDDPPRAQRVDLRHQHRRIQHHPVADDAGLPGVEDPARDEGEDRLLARHHQGMPGVVPALEPHHHLGVLGEQVDDLALPFVAPLGTYHHDVRHGRTRAYSPRPAG